MYNKLNEEQKEIVDSLLKEYNLTKDEVTIGEHPTSMPIGLPYLFIIPNDKEKRIINTSINLEDIK